MAYRDQDVAYENAKAQACDAQDRISTLRGGIANQQAGLGPKVLTCTDRAERIFSQARELASLVHEIRSRMAGSIPESASNSLKNPNTAPPCLEEILDSCAGELDIVIGHAQFVRGRL